MVFSGGVMISRKMELLKLHEKNIDFTFNTIFIPANMEKCHKNKTIPLPSALNAKFQKLVMNSASGYLFENRSTGNHYGDIKNAWRKALKTAGIQDFRFHDLRHTFASYSLIASRDLRTVQSVLGLSRISTTEKYTNVCWGKKDRY